MTNLLIGLGCIASALALVVMWRVAVRFEAGEAERRLVDEDRPVLGGDREDPTR